MNKSEKMKKITELYIYPVALFILPLLTVNQGVDVSDSTYSLGNYLFADRLDGMWVISTYISNLIGSAIVHLPGGSRLLIANIYTGIILSAIALMVYFFLKKDFDSSYVFLGESIAVCLCWIPTGILYNYISYFFMTAGALLLYKAIKNDSFKLMFAAGVILGLNVFARIPNVTQMALILALWAYAAYTGMKFKDVVTRTGVCIGGYILGLIIPLIAIIAKFGIAGVRDMVEGLAGITSTDETYTPLSMIWGTIQAYVRSSKWLLLVLLVVVAGIVMYKIWADKFLALKTVVYFGAIALMIRFFWGRGMFSFRYYEDYSSMYEWGMLALFLSIIIDVYILIFVAKDKKEYSILAVISLVIIMIAPLGSNNYTYQNLNNMFVVMPVSVIMGFYIINNVVLKGDRAYGIPVTSMFFALLFCIVIQSFGFNLKFVFRDGMRGEPRDTEIVGIESLQGMYTNSEHANNLMGMGNYIENICPDSLILYGDCPGLTYILNRPSALFSSWADLDSNPVEMVETDLIKIAESGENVAVIIRNNVSDSINYEKKMNLIQQFISENSYALSYEDTEFSVYIKE